MRFLLPQHCFLCGSSTRDVLLCGACNSSLPRLGAARCEVCALPIASGNVCGGCLDRPPHFDRVTAVFAYRFPMDALIHAFKYGGNLAIAQMLGHALAEAVAAERADLVVPMPLSPLRLKSRGFNQAHEIARRVGGLTGIAVAARICRKVAETPPQAALPWKERARNVRGAFVCDADFTGLKVAIIDDVMTTGATLDELARLLKRAGAVEVNGWMVARALRVRDSMKHACLLSSYAPQGRIHETEMGID
jgi:ComF family protein